MKGKYIFVITGIVLICALAIAATLDRTEILPAFGGETGRVTVVIDPGHGGEDSGAVGICGTYEKTINLAVSQKLSDLLGLLGVNTRMTRSTDVSIHTEGSEGTREKKVTDIKNRVKLVNITPNATLISIHENYFPQESCSGAQIFYSGGNKTSKQLAERVQNAVIAGLDTKNHRVAKQGDAHIYLLKNVTCPAILVECGFLSNKREEKKLADESYQKKIAASIAAGFLDYQTRKE
ncbi:MAG: N-acetylmuramoyl-L-alanine amidase [Clostridia bacterium]